MTAPRDGSARTLGGARLAASIKTHVASVIADWNDTGVEITLAVVVATDEESTLRYVRSIAAAAAKVGVKCRIVDLGTSATEQEIADHLDELSGSPQVHGIILQTPVPNAARRDSHDLPLQIPAARRLHQIGRHHGCRDRTRRADRR